MKKAYITILLSLIFQFGASQTQEPVYLNFFETYDPNGLDLSNSGSCITYGFEESNTYANKFSFQIKDNSRIYPIEENGVDYIALKVDGTDSNCGGVPSRRSEAVFLETSNKNIAWYKIRFYIPNDFIIPKAPGNTLLDYTDHTIFQIIINEADGSFSNYKVDPLPQFLLQFEHESSSSSSPVFSFNYGLEFRVKNPYVNCTPCGTSPLANCQLNNGVADIHNQHYGGSSMRQVLTSADTPSGLNAAVYGWNEIKFKVKWSDTNSGYMDIWLNDSLLENTNPLDTNSFKGPNVYNRNMFPLISPNNGSDPSQKVDHIIKFGHYRYIYGQDQANTTSELYLDYFLADNESYNIDNNFETNVINDALGVLDLKDDILCDEVHNADEFIFLFQDTQTVPSTQQYLGNNVGGTPHILTYDRLLDALDLEFYKDYTVVTRARFYDGFNGKYSNPKTIRLEPDTKLTPEFCGNLNVSQSEKLKVEKLKGADGYVLLIQDVTNPTNTYYHGVPSTGEINVSTLFNDLPLVFNREYLVNTRARFDQYGMQGSYSTACSVKFVPTSTSSKTIVYPNPTKGKFFLKSNISFDQIKVFDISGNIVKVYSKSEVLEGLDLEELRRGLYFLVINDGKQTESFTIMKE